MASLQEYRNKILIKKHNLFVIMYLNNIFILIKDPNQGHMITILKIFNFLRKFGLYAKLKKWQFYQDEFDFFELCCFRLGYPNRK